MKPIEYWFLDAAIRLKIPMYWLPAGNVDELLNRRHHNLSKSELLVVLGRMFERGELFLEYRDKPGHAHRTQTPSRDEIEAALYTSPDTRHEQSQPALYGVTARGGALWETLSQPEWDRFYEEGYDIDPYKGEMTAVVRGLIEERLAMIPYDLLIKAIVPESVRWSVVQPWQATYWKQLPIGYRVEFAYLPLSEAEKLARATPHDRAGALYQPERRWYTSYLEPEE